MVWVAIIACALARPTHGWYGAVFLMALGTVLTRVLVIVYCDGQRRAVAIGFLVFSIGHLLARTFMTGSLDESIYSGWAPLHEVWDWLFDRIHSNGEWRTDFDAICNLALTCALGVLGGMVSGALFEARIQAKTQSQ
jgi:hypothetical protein